MAVEAGGEFTRVARAAVDLAVVHGVAGGFRQILVAGLATDLHGAFLPRAVVERAVAVDVAHAVASQAPHALAHMDVGVLRIGGAMAGRAGLLALCLCHRVAGLPVGVDPVAGVAALHVAGRLGAAEAVGRESREAPEAPVVVEDDPPVGEVEAAAVETVVAVGRWCGGRRLRHDDHGRQADQHCRQVKRETKSHGRSPQAGRVRGRLVRRSPVSGLSAEAPRAKAERRRERGAKLVRAYPTSAGRRSGASDRQGTPWNFPAPGPSQWR